ncbi:MAG: DUF2125 domain-containing protein [Tagaea sp.]|nr:DUF2125 domain-containing protein [Tagaea sp.]
MKRLAKHAAYAAIALVFVWTVAWMYVAREIVRQVDAWRAERAQAGVTLAWDAFDVKGWPLQWRATATNARAAGAGALPWSWSGERLTARIVPWNPGEIRARLPGAQRATFGATTLALRAARPDATLVLDSADKLVRLDLDFEAIEAALDGGKPVQIRKLDLSLARPHGDLLDAKLLAQAIRLAEPVAPLAAFGTDIARAEFAGQLRGPIAGAASLGPALRAWRDAGGTLEASALALDWGPLRLAGEGTLALDERDRPLGAGTVRLAGWNEAIDALQAARALEPTPAAILKAALGFLGRVGGGEPGTVRVPVAAQDGRLVVHRIPVANLPSLRLE